MIRFNATYGEGAIAKFKAINSRPWGRLLTFYEDSPETADVFFRRLTRNLYGILLSPPDYTLVAVPETPDSRFGFIGEVDERAQALAKPGMCGA